MSIESKSVLKVNYLIFSLITFDLFVSLLIKTFVIVFLFVCIAATNFRSWSRYR